MPSIIDEVVDTPGTHVLVIGVSRYRHFGDGDEPTKWGELLDMTQLGSAARSASEFAAWMMDKADGYRNDNAPLSSLRILLSPASDEKINPVIKTLMPADSFATSTNVRAEIAEFMNVCATHQDNVAVVYVVGHGVQLSKSGSILLLQDVGNKSHLNVLEGSLDMARFHAAMNYPGTAQRQFWFVDACRQKPDIARRFESLEGGIRLDERPGMAASTAIFYSASTGTSAYERDQGVSFFAEALLEGLKGGIATAPEEHLSNRWHVSVMELVKKLPGRVAALAEAANKEQTVAVTGQVADALFHEYASTPSVKLSIALSPPAMQPQCTGSLRHGQGKVIREAVTEWPLLENVEAGIYEISVTHQGGGGPFSRIDRVSPPETIWKIEVTV